MSEEKILSWIGEQPLSSRRDQVPEEVPVALSFNGLAYAVMMATPLDLHDFARGFALTEQIVHHRNQIYGIELQEVTNGWTVDVHIHGECAQRLALKQRNLLGRTGCGLCGRESLDSVAFPEVRLPNSIYLAHSAVQRAISLMAEAQVLNRLSGGVHAAALFSESGERLCLKEDVGRHNALDKLIGATEDCQLRQGVIAVTSRVSYELVEKTAIAGCEVLIAVSTVTDRAIRAANHVNLTLIGFARPGRHNIYSGAHRLMT